MFMMFASDLDNTLIYSYKNAKDGDVCVETKDGRRLSFMPPKSRTLLREISGNVLFVPVTTRSLEQYSRLDLGVKPRYALAANGAVLIMGGKVCESWTDETHRLLNAKPPCINENAFLYDIRCVDGFFVCAKSDAPAQAVNHLKDVVCEKHFVVKAVQNKVYIMPKGLDKGTALRRLLKRLGVEKAICAGDGILDIPMLEAADIAVFPKTLGLDLENSHVLDADAFVHEALNVVKKLAEQPQGFS